MTELRTALTRRLGIEHPVICAPMSRCTGGKLAAAVSDAGGLGLIGGTSGDVDWLNRELVNAGNVPVGVGFITWLLAERPELLDAALDHRPSAVMLSFGDHRPFADAVKQAGVPLICQVQSVSQALEVVAAGADVVVAQGQEAGGHGVAGLGTMTLAPAVASALDADVPVVAAGGIADGRGLAAALTLGCSGVLMGTRFVATPESLWPDSKKAALLDARGEDTVRTEVFDVLRRGRPWPAPFTGRALRNAAVERWHGRPGELLENLQSAMARFAEDEARGDPSGGVVWAGESVERVRDLSPAAELVTRTAAEAAAILADPGEHGIELA